MILEAIIIITKYIVVVIIILGFERELLMIGLFCHFSIKEMKSDLDFS